MELTNEILAKYIGGDMEIQNSFEEYLFRGPIASAVITEDMTLKVKFKWLAKGVGFPPLPEKWIKADLHSPQDAE